MREGRNNIEGFVLAGGASSRMGTDKSRLMLGGGMMLERCAAALHAVADSVAVVGFAGTAPDGMTVIPDEIRSDERGRGAIIGVFTALKNGGMDWAALLACDLPFVSGEMLERLVSFVNDEVDAVVPVQPDGRPQPLCGLYRRDACLRAIEEMLGEGDWKLQNLLPMVRTRLVGFDEVRDLVNSEVFFLNVNTPEDYARALAIAGRS